MSVLIQQNINKINKEAKNFHCLSHKHKIKKLALLIKTSLQFIFPHCQDWCKIFSDKGSCSEMMHHYCRITVIFLADIERSPMAGTNSRPKKNTYKRKVDISSCYCFIFLVILFFKKSFQKSLKHCIFVITIIETVQFYFLRTIK